MKQICLHIPLQLFARLRAKQQESGLTMADIIRRALDVYLPPTPPAP
jgi:hypothetical protein